MVHLLVLYDHTSKYLPFSIRRTQQKMVVQNEKDFFFMCSRTSEV